MAGDARLALEAFRGQVSLPGAVFERVRRAMEQPQPRVALGLALRRAGGRFTHDNEAMRRAAREWRRVGETGEAA